MTIKGHLESFKAHLEHAGASERTVDCYVRHAREFVAFLTAYYPRVSRWNQVGKDIVRDYQTYLSQLKGRGGRPQANTSLRLKLTALKKLFGYLVSQDLVIKDPTSVIVSPKEEQRLTRDVLTEAEVLDLLRTVEPRDPVSTRNRAIVELFYACGIRTSELCNLKIQDVNLSEFTATIVKGKGGRSRIVPIGQYAAHYVGLYLEKARKHMLKGRPDNPGNLFLSSRGRPFNRSTINRTVMESIRRNLKLEKHLSCYTFRATVATHLIAHNVDIAHVAQLLGHSSLETTRRYLRIEIGDLKRMHSLYHPREARSDGTK